ncbi:MAG: diacylglycerol kinase [Elusimicrobiota bacterium]
MSRKDQKKDIEKPGIIKSFNYAIDGLLYAVKTQRNMRIHFIVAVMVLLFSLFLNLSRVEIIVLVLTISIVLITEILNTGVELIVDLITEQHHPIAKIIKDLAAGAVLFSSISAAIIGYLIFIRGEVLHVFEKSFVLEKITAYPPYLTGVVIFLVIVVTLFIKAVSGKRARVVGGMPSLHTALASSLAAIIFFASGNIYMLLLALFMVLLVAESRVSGKFHTVGEVIVGGILGLTLTTFVFQILVKL